MIVIVKEGRIITRVRLLSHRYKGVSPSPANLDRVKRSYVAVTMFYRDDRRRCIEGVRYDVLSRYVGAPANTEEV